MVNNQENQAHPTNHGSDNNQSTKQVKIKKIILIPKILIQTVGDCLNHDFLDGLDGLDFDQPNNQGHLKIKKILFKTISESGF